MPKEKNIEVEGMRAMGKGNIKVKMVNIPIKFFSGEQVRESTSLNRVCPHCSGDVGNKFQCKECDKDLQYGEIKKGYKLNKETKILIDEHELDWLKGDMPNAIETVKTVDVEKINKRLFLKGYFICPLNGDAVQPFEIFRSALQEANKGLLCKFCIRSDIRYAVIYPQQDRLVAHTLRYNSELRDITVIPTDNSTQDAESVGMMKQILDGMAGQFSEDDLKDTREEKFQEFIQKKVNGEEISIPKPELKMPDTGFAEQLKASLEAV